MPWEKGKTGNPNGRPGFEIEQAQLEQMRRILGRDLKLVEKYQLKAKLTKDEKELLKITQIRILKIMDKLHASKETTDLTSGGKPLELVISDCLANRYNLKNDANTKTTGDNK